jgi:hypothetical protein
MGRNRRRAAYVEFVGKVRGLFTFWTECNAQIHGYSCGHQRGYDSEIEARTAWEEYVRSTHLAPNSEPENIPERFPVAVSIADHVPLIKFEEGFKPTRKRTFEAVMATTSPIKSTPTRLKIQKNAVKDESPPDILVRNQSPKVKCEAPPGTVAQNRFAKFKYEGLR